MLPHDQLIAFRSAPKTFSWSERTVMLYALAIGMGENADDPRTLRFVYERDLAVMPSLMATLGLNTMPSARDMGCDPVQLIHASQAIALHRPIPATGEAVSTSRIVSAVDKGERGAIVTVETEIVESGSGVLLASLVSTTLARDGGGIGGPRGSAVPLQPTRPERAPDVQVTIATRRDQALLYRLLGDYNPLHADPAEARRVGFDGPILHGLCTYGIACRALVETLCDYRPEQLKSHAMRFSAPVYPGETLRFDIWREGEDAFFEARAVERDVIVVRDGHGRII